MRRLCLLTVASALATWAVGVASADSGPGPGNGSPPYPFVVGAGTALTDFGEQHATVSAHLGPNGPSGHYSFRFGTDERAEGQVECMIVEGNRAVAGGPLREPVILNGILVQYGGVSVEDNGEGGLVPDRVYGHYLLAGTFARLCDPTAVIAPTILLFPVETGNFVVNSG